MFVCALCMYVCMYVCTVCMHVRMYAYFIESRSIRVCTVFVCMYVRNVYIVYVRMYVCICIHINSMLTIKDEFCLPTDLLPSQQCLSRESGSVRPYPFPSPSLMHYVPPISKFPPSTHGYPRFEKIKSHTYIYAYHTYIRYH